jgi:hypothetical protein
MPTFIYAHDADASVVPHTQARNGPVAWKKMDDAIEPKCLGKNDIDRKSVGENSNPRFRIALARDVRECGQNSCSKFLGIRAKVANWILQKAPPFLASLSAQRLGRSITALPAIGFRPTFRNVDRQSAELRERLRGLTRPCQGTGDDASDAFAGEQRCDRSGLKPAIHIQRGVVRARGLVFIRAAVAHKDDFHNSRLSGLRPEVP